MLYTKAFFIFFGLMFAISNPAIAETSHMRSVLLPSKILPLTPIQKAKRLLFPRSAALTQETYSCTVATVPSACGETEKSEVLEIAKETHAAGLEFDNTGHGTFGITEGSLHFLGVDGTFAISMKDAHGNFIAESKVRAGAPANLYVEGSKIRVTCLPKRDSVEPEPQEEVNLAVPPGSGSLLEPVSASELVEKSVLDQDSSNEIKNIVVPPGSGKTQEPISADSLKSFTKFPRVRANFFNAIPLQFRRW